MSRQLYQGDHPDVANSLNDVANERLALGRAAELTAAGERNSERVRAEMRAVLTAAGIGQQDATNAPQPALKLPDAS